MRRFIRNSSRFYPLYVRHVLRNEAARFPGKNTNLHLTGFPRSANTYCLNILRVAFPDLDICTHIHTAASLKLAVWHDVPTIVLVRDPVSTCCSMLLKQHIQPTPKEVKSLLKDYIEYHVYVFSHKERFQVLRFEDVVSSPKFIILSVSELLKLSISYEEVEAKAEEGHRLVELKESQKAVEGSSLPNETRRKMKLGLEEHVVNHPHYARAQVLYESITL